jgi:hypothetical protein
MASNDYYNSFTPRPAHTGPDAPLPPLPPNQSTQSISPVTSPFDDDRRYDYPSSSHQNLAQHQAPMGYSDTSYHPPANQQYQDTYHSSSHNGDPFADQNAIPLQSHDKMDASPTRYQADPEGRLYVQGPGRGGRNKKKGWFSGRITWVVYILTLVQCGVFVGELIRNGTYAGLHSWSL